MSDSMPLMANTTSTDTKTASAGSTTARTPLDSTGMTGSGDPFSAVLNTQLDTAGTTSSQFPTELLRLDPSISENAAETGNGLPAEAATLGLPPMLPANEPASSIVANNPLGHNPLLASTGVMPVGLQAEQVNKPISAVATGLPETSSLTDVLKRPVVQKPDQQMQQLGLNQDKQLGLNQDNQLMQSITGKAQDMSLPASTNVQSNAITPGQESILQNGQSQPQQGIASIAGLGVGTATRTDLVPAPITVPPQHPGWNNAVGERIQWMLGNNLQQADIRLDPPELGSLEVRIQVNKDQTTVMFSAPSQQVRDVLESAVPRLREMMNEMGLSLGDVGVSQESFKQSQETSDENNLARGIQSEDEIENVTTVNNSIVTGSSAGLLDMYA